MVDKGDIAAELAHRDERIATLSADLERERMRLAGCGVAALCDTPKSAEAQRIGKDNPYWSASYGDVCRQIDELMRIRVELAAAQAEAQARRGMTDDELAQLKLTCYAAFETAVDAFKGRQMNAEFDVLTMADKLVDAIDGLAYQRARMVLAKDCDKYDPEQKAAEHVATLREICERIQAVCIVARAK